MNTSPPVGAAEGCDLLTLFFKNQIKRSQPSAAPTGIGFASPIPWGVQVIKTTA
jgi:hypothetical protein